MLRIPLLHAYISVRLGAMSVKGKEKAVEPAVVISDEEDEAANFFMRKKRRRPVVRAGGCRDCFG